MAYVVTDLCLGTLDQSCVEVCPVDCFYYNPSSALNEGEGRPLADGTKPGMLMIHPDECINCGACETECPASAIFEDSAIPDKSQKFAKLNEDYCLALSDEEREELNVTSRRI
jgi:NAD-dependent dihydropyrimidine dehydrogenase PreA subunit